MYVVRENRDLEHMYPAAKRRVLNCGAHDLGVTPPDQSLSEPRVPRDVRVKPECSMSHGLTLG